MLPSFLPDCAHLSQQIRKWRTEYLGGRLVTANGSQLSGADCKPFNFWVLLFFSKLKINQRSRPVQVSRVQFLFVYVLFEWMEFGWQCFFLFFNPPFTEIQPRRNMRVTHRHNITSKPFEIQTLSVNTLKWNTHVISSLSLWVVWWEISSVGSSGDSTLSRTRFSSAEAAVRSSASHYMWRHAKQAGILLPRTKHSRSCWFGIWKKHWLNQNRSQKWWKTKLG